ncbi:MAG: phage holin [Clostridiales bacterium]|nr:phage holin [Clostridiales bacterium]
MTGNKISAGTIARTIILMLALVNQCLNIAGVQMIPISDEDINLLASTLWTVAASLAAWWKNNSFTRAALAGDARKDELKAGEG